MYRFEQFFFHCSFVFKGAIVIFQNFIEMALVSVRSVPNCCFFKLPLLTWVPLPPFWTLVLELTTHPLNEHYQNKKIIYMVFMFLMLLWNERWLDSGVIDLELSHFKMLYGDFPWMPLVTWIASGLVHVCHHSLGFGNLKIRRKDLEPQI